MRGLTLEQVAELTRVSPQMLRRIEAGDLAALPAGIHGRAHLRAYARAVGVDPDEIIAMLGDQVPLEPDPLEALRERERRRFATDHPLTASLVEGSESLYRAADGATRRALSTRRTPAHLGRRAAAALIDAGILSGMGGLTVVLAAGLTHSSVDELWRAARWPLVVSCGLMVTFYFTLSQSLGGRSTGAALVAWLTQVIQHRHAQAAARRHAS
jgi:transcriptional regulator with XRE-family HTH domain